MALVPVILSLLVLGAHFFRAGQFPFVALVLALLGIVWVRRPWAARVLQAALVLGALEWGRSLVEIANRRLHEGQPWVRLVVILGSVTLVTALSALAFQAPAMRRRYRIDPPAGR